MRLPEAWGRLTMDELNMIGGDVIQHPPYRVCINCEVFFFPNPKHVATPKYVTNLAMPRLCEGKSASLFGWIRLHVMLMEDEHGYMTLQPLW
jgi:hypothetical protein